nr:hypothetical protein [Kribbella antibiotica]
MPGPRCCGELAAATGLVDGWTEALIDDGGNALRHLRTLRDQPHLVRAGRCRPDRVAP